MLLDSGIIPGCIGEITVVGVERQDFLRREDHLGFDVILHPGCKVFRSLFILALKHTGLRADQKGFINGQGRVKHKGGNDIVNGICNPCMLVDSPEGYFVEVVTAVLGGSHIVQSRRAEARGIAPNIGCKKILIISDIAAMRILLTIAFGLAIETAKY